MRWVFLCLLLLVFCRRMSIAPAEHPVPRPTSASFPDPRVDPFYAQDQAQLDAAPPGHLLRARSVVTDFTRNVASVSQLYYRTTNTIRDAQGTVATVWQPSRPRSPPQILSFHTYQDSASFNCNPSWALIPGTASHGKIPISLDSSVYIQWALDRGIYVIVPDHLGPDAAWLAGFQAGAAVLDGIRALRHHYDLPDDAQVALLGYSGGGHATVWASQLASSYAPDVHIIGDVSGGTIFDDETAFQYIDGTIFSGFAGAGLVGLMNAYPDLEEHVMANFDDEGKRKLAVFRGENVCIPEVFVTNPFTNYTRHFTNDDPIRDPVVNRVMRQETLFSDYSSTGVAVPAYPRLIWHAELDTVVPLSGAVRYVEEQCANGANIQFEVIPKTEHISALMLGIPGVLVFLEHIYDHSTPQLECGSADPDFPTLLSLRARGILGEQAFHFIYNLDGQSLAGTTLQLILPWRRSMSSLSSWWAASSLHQEGLSTGARRL
jgi:acetyl esterase/lipase